MNVSALEANMTTALQSVYDGDHCFHEMDDAPADLAQLVKIRALAIEVNKGLAEVREMLDDQIGETMGKYEVVVEGAGVLRRHTKKARSKWDRDALVRDVKDSRLVDATTGEVKDESPLDKIMHVWNLGAPRTTALKDRGLAADDYCETEVRPGWSLEIK